MSASAVMACPLVTCPLLNAKAIALRLNVLMIAIAAQAANRIVLMGCVKFRHGSATPNQVLAIAVLQVALAVAAVPVVAVA
ncbi:MAG: hypothetical protein ACK5HO_02190 [Pseudomonadota bacterium]